MTMMLLAGRILWLRSKSSKAVAKARGSDENRGKSTRGKNMLQRVIVLLAALFPAVAYAADSYTLTVSAGEADRTATPVTFTLPENFPDGNWYLTSANEDIPL